MIKQMAPSKTMRHYMRRILEKYLERYPDEKEGLSRLLKLVEHNEGDYRNLFNRKNFEGHITASGFIYCPDNNGLLLLEHKALNIFLQPGGHVKEEDKDIISGAIRETVEETGLKNLSPVSISDDINVPFDINSHIIPKREEKQEAEHYHHDFGYLFIVDKPEDIKLNHDESKSFKWVNVNNLLTTPRHGQVARKIKVIMTKRKDYHE